MLTFNQIYSEAQTQTQDTDTTTSLPLIKRAINQGMRKFASVLNRDWRNGEKTFTTVASQVYYQAPEDMIRIKFLTVTVGSTTYDLQEIADGEIWRLLNMRAQSSSAPQYYHQKGSDQYGIYPALSGAYTATIGYEPSMRDMAQDDYTTGTVTVTNGSDIVTGTGTVWTASMVGRTLFVTDGSADGMGYKIQSFTSSTSIKLENYYGGTTGSAKTYLIGEVPDIPEEYHESLVDYALFRYYRFRRDIPTSKEMYATFVTSLEECRTIYSSASSSQYYRRPRIANGYVHIKQDLTIP